MRIGETMMRIMRRSLLSVLAASFAVVAIECLLRVVGFGDSPTFFIPEGTAGVLRSHDRFAWRFTPPEISRVPCPIRMAAAKPPGTTRIFVLGSSAAQGFPDPAYSVGRFLEVMLEDAFTGDVEIVNTALTAMNSHVVRVIAAECAAYDPDVFVVYCGNNEVIGPFGPGTVFDAFQRSPRIVRFQVWLSGTRTAQAVRRIVRSLRPSGPHGWGGMQMFAAHRINADDPRMEAVREHFRRNLEAICATASGAGARVLLCTVPVNLRDCPPFSPTNRLGGATAGELFAASRFQEACDADGLRFRADSALNEVIRSVAASGRAQRVELAAQLDGNAHFHEHAHLNVTGTWRAAEMLFVALGGTNASSLERCRDVLALTPRDEFRLQLGVADLRSAPPFTFQSDQAAQRERQAKLLARLREALTPAADAAMRATYAAALRNRPDDHWLQAGAANFLAATGDHPAAVGAWQRAVELRPGDGETRLKFALALGKVGRSAEAVALIREEAERAPRLPLVRKALGDLLAMQGDFAGAKASYRNALRLYPEFSDAAVNLAALCQRDGTEGVQEAFKLLQDVLARQDHAHGHAAMSSLLLRTGRFSESLPHFEKALSDLPPDAGLHNNCGLVLLELGRIPEARRQFEAALRINPNHAAARRSLDKIMARAAGSGT